MRSWPHRPRAGRRNRERSICDRQATIHTNPKIVTGCLPVFEDRVLLCRRAIEPRSAWTLPGFMKTASRSKKARGGRRWKKPAPTSRSTISTRCSAAAYLAGLHVLSRATARAGLRAGEEFLVVELFREDQIPWEQLAFPVVTDTLRHFFNDREREVFPMRSSTIEFGRRLGGSYRSGFPATARHPASANAAQTAPVRP